MRHIIKLESYTDMESGPHVGDYVVCHEEGTGNLCLFLDSNIGNFLYTKNGSCLIEYYDVPRDLIRSFRHGDERKIYEDRNIRRMFRKEIIYWSSNREDCEAFLAAKKYNL